MLNSLQKDIPSYYGCFVPCRPQGKFSLFDKCLLKAVERNLLCILCRFEVIKTLREDCASIKAFVEKLNSGFSQNQSVEADRWVSDITDQEQKQVALLFEDLVNLKKVMATHPDLKMSELEPILKQKLLLRHNIQLVKTACTRLLQPITEGEITIDNCSSAHSTPINCKSLQSSA